MRLWEEPFVKLRVPLIFNLRRDPFERADFNSNTYWTGWSITPQLYLMQEVVAEQIEDFEKFPPRQKPASFNLDDGDAAGGGPPSQRRARSERTPRQPAGVATGDPSNARSASRGPRAFYERYPYPPPVDSLDSYRQLWQDRQAPAPDYHLFWPARSYRDDHSILVAGCGTSQAAKHAMRWPAARVTGIDVSATSVRCTEELKRKYDLDNLEVHQLADRARAASWGRRFDQIVCTGVLHHLADPDAGLRGAARRAASRTARCT